MISYFLFRLFGVLISLLPYTVIHAIGRILGTLLYYVHTPFRKKALSNLAIAYGSSLSEKERTKIAKRSFRHLMITCLEFFRLKRSKNHFDRLIIPSNPRVVLDLTEKKQGIVFFTGHQANWEIPFLAITQRCGPGIAIGRPIKNRPLYRWVLSVREMFGGKIVMPKNALKEGLKALRKGEFIGIVGDQALPQSDYSYPLFGTRAWTTTAPALLAYKTNSPIIVGTTKREKGKYIVHASDPIWPNLERPMKEEVKRMMDKTLSLFEKSIRDCPEQWMWVHDRWKQQTIDHVKRQYRYGFVLITLPPDVTPYLEILFLLRKIYPRSFLSIYAPAGSAIRLKDAAIHYYKKESDLFQRDWRQQLLIDFYDSALLRRHFHKLGCSQTLSLQKMRKISQQEELYQIIKQTLVKSECLLTVSF
ncbi:MAG: hypothetical protein ACKVOH_00750 [Chlamydiales bacterium]